MCLQDVYMFVFKWSFEANLKGVGKGGGGLEGGGP